MTFDNPIRAQVTTNDYATPVRHLIKRAHAAMSSRAAAEGRVVVSPVRFLRKKSFDGIENVYVFEFEADTALK